MTRFFVSIVIITIGNVIAFSVLNDGHPTVGMVVSFLTGTVCADVDNYLRTRL